MTPTPNGAGRQIYGIITKVMSKWTGLLMGTKRRLITHGLSYKIGVLKYY